MDAGRHSLFRRSRRRFYWLLTRGLILLAGCLPLFLGRELGRGLVGMALGLRPKEVSCARNNLLIAFPELDSTCREQLLRQAKRALGANLFDTMVVPRLLARPGLVVSEPAGRLTGEIQPSGLLEVLAGLAGMNRGVMILTGHIGCWELLGGWLAREIPAAGLGRLGVVTGTIHNQPVDRLVQDKRRSLGMKVLPREDGIRPLLDHLGSGSVVAVLLDQNTRVQNLPVSFFGKSAPTAAGFARIILRRGIPVLPVAIARAGEGHVVRYLDPILSEPLPELGSDPEVLENFLGECNLALEKLIRRNPAEWVWFHDRWNDRGANSAVAVF